jgi:hypothetical protein
MCTSYRSEAIILPVASLWIVIGYVYFESESYFANGGLLSTSSS